MLRISGIFGERTITDSGPNPSADDVFCSLAPINVGFSNLWKLNNKNAIELNFNGGLMLYNEGFDFDL